MAKREKIIIGVMIAIILYGAIDFLFLSNGSDKGGVIQNRAADLEKFLVEAATSLTSGEKGSGRDDLFIISQASIKWENDPFFKGDLAGLIKIDSAPAPKLTGEELGFRYTGYIEAGETRIAVVNGSEYLVGDEIVVGAGSSGSQPPKGPKLGGSIGGLSLGGTGAKNNRREIPDIFVVDTIMPTHVILTTKDGRNKVMIPMEEIG